MLHLKWFGRGKTMNRIVGISIPGLTKGTEYDMCRSSVNIYKSTLDINTLKRSVSGFTVNDFPFPELFKIYPNKVRKVINTTDIYPEDTTIPVEMAVVGEDPPFAENDYLWIHKELVKVTELNEITPENYWEVGVLRGQRGTVAKRYMGDTNRLLAKYNEFTHRNYLELHKRDYRGLRVELWDIADEDSTPTLLAVGIIKAYSIRSGVVILDCEDIVTALQVDLPVIKNVDEKGNEVDAGFNLSRMLYFGIGYPENRDNGISVNNPADWFYEDQPELYQYMESESKFGLWCFNSVYNRGLFNKRSFKLSELVELMEFLTLEFFTFENGKFKLLPLLKQVSVFEGITYEEKSLLKDLSGAAYITEPVMMPNVITVQFDDQKVNYNMKNRIGLATESTMTITIPQPYDPFYLRNILETLVLNYSGFVDFAVCLLKFNMPELKLYQDYQTGDFIKIKDIRRIETLQEEGNEVLQYAIVTKIDKEEIQMIVTDYRIFRPIAPMLEISSYERHDNGGEIGYNFYFDGNISMVPSIIWENITLVQNSPYPETSPRKYFDGGELVRIYDENYNEIEYGTIIGISDGSTSSTVYSILWVETSAEITTPKYVGWGTYSQNSSNAYRNKFFYVNANGSNGGGVWV